MVVLEHLGMGWGAVSRHLGGWVALIAVYVLTVVGTLGVGLALTPNLYRVTARALEDDAAPRIPDLLDLDQVGDDVLLLALCAVVWLVGQAVPFVGSFLVAALLVWAPPLVADGHYRPGEAILLSIRAVARAPVDALVFQVAVLVLLGMSVMLCFWPLLFALPVVLTGTWILYEQRRAELLALGDALGLRRAG